MSSTPFRPLSKSGCARLSGPDSRPAAGLARHRGGPHTLLPRRRPARARRSPRSSRPSTGWRASRASEGTRVLYVSPLKALAYDIERNLRAPLRGHRRRARQRRHPHRRHAPEGARGDARNPPDILITTPESLYLMLTSQAREMLAGVETVIVDEIHAVAGTKRGSHLALTLERLEAHGARRTPRSARTTRPPADRPQRHPEPARGDRPLPRRSGPRGHDRRRGRAQGARPADRGAGRVDDRARRPPAPASATRSTRCQGSRPRAPRSGRRSTPSCCELVREHTSTIVFVNNRRSAERIALRLNELATRSSRTSTATSPRASLRSSSPAPTTARSRARSARRSRSC